MNHTRRTFLLGTSAALAAFSDESLIWDPDKIRWQREEDGGARYAVLDGDRDNPGSSFSYAFSMPSGLWVKAHTHTQQAHVTVVRGTLLLGFGRRMDKSKFVRVRAGQHFIVRAGVPHYEGAEGETLIIGAALGGWKTTNLEP
jgi:quercetin dioxygenase-like cupin family protein